jgi:hypothetical protein
MDLQWKRLHNLSIHVLITGYEAKPRRKLKEIKAKNKVKTAVPREVVETADASVQTDMVERTNEEVKTKMTHIMKLLKLTSYICR